jgi:dihydrofolate synthase/folylpolyglutamate synthase
VHGAYLSPHLLTFRERVRVGEEDVGADEFADAVAEVARAARRSTARWRRATASRSSRR